MKYLILSLLIVQSTYSLNAQKIEYKSYFIKENKTIGDTIYFISTINYPKNIEIIQPDSSNDYKTFEYIDKLIFPSLKIEDRVLDSTIYLLRTFNTDTIQSLKLSSYIINNNDSLKITSTEDDLIISSQIKKIDQSLKVKYNTILSKINKLINYKYVTYIIAIILLIIGLTYILFGKKIVIFFKIHRLKKAFKSFETKFQKQQMIYKKEKSKNEIEKLLVIWKVFMEFISNKTYLSSTTKEIEKFNSNKKIIGSLKEFDKNIYSPNKNTLKSKDINNVFNEAKHNFNVKLKNTKNG
tara:strand:+ start:1512 stop:2399 length:888 start_codon:yes stop_codon:yes gene_type:complete